MKQAEKKAKLSAHSVVQLTETLVENADQDECQLMDELNEEWVQAWRQAVKATVKHKRAGFNV